MGDSERHASHESLSRVSSTDGREAQFVQKLSPYVSEGALHRYRGVVEIENLIHLAQAGLAGIPAITQETKQKMRELVLPGNFDATAVNDYDHFGRNGIGPTEHDVKSVELYLREEFDNHGLSAFKEFIHFPATSEDINNIAYNLMFRDALNNVVLPSVLETGEKLADLAIEFADTPVLGKTHGMNASPTTIGKRFAYHLDKLEDSLDALSSLHLQAKFSGPVGNHNAMTLVAPEFDMLTYEESFVQGFGFLPALVENQRISHQDIVRALQEIQLINTIGIDINENIRHGVMMGWLYQEGKDSHVGSSVMPHKINPWFFEVGQGYLEQGNALISQAPEGLLVSVFERDLTDHPWERAYGEMLGKTTIGFSYISEGLDTLRVDTEFTREELNKNPEVLSEAFQIGARMLGIDNSYMKIKEATRGKKLTLKALRKLMKKELPKSDIREVLLQATPDTYIGTAAQNALGSAQYFLDKYRGREFRVLDTLGGIDAYLFDFDNTIQLGDKEELYARLTEISDRLNMNFTPEEIREFGNRSDYREMRSMMINEYNLRTGNDLGEAEFTAVNNQVSGMFDDHFYLDPSAMELFEILHNQGKHLGLVTTRGSNSLPRLLKHHGLEDVFDEITNRDDAKERKPHPQPILNNLKKLGVDPHNAMYIGDKQVDDIIAGNSIGMKTALINPEPLDEFGAQPNYHFADLSGMVQLVERR